MGDRDDVDLVLECEVEREAGTIAVSEHTDLRDARALQVRYNLTGARLRKVDAIRAKPCTQIEGGTRVQCVRRARLLEEVWHDNLEPVASEIIRKELNHMQNNKSGKSVGGVLMLGER